MGERERWVPPTPGPAEMAAGLLGQLTGWAAAPVARGPVHAELYRLFRGDDAPGPAPVPAPGDAGWFGPDSLIWRVHASASMYVGAIAALAFQALHPLAMAGVSEHSDYRENPRGRLERTAKFVGVTAYGTTAEAAGACAAIKVVHGRVTGLAPDGRPYAASDPELLDWVHTAEFAAFAAANRRFNADPMTEHQLDRYIGEVARIAEALGDPDPPRDWPEVDDHLERHRPNLAVNEQTRSVWHFLRQAGSVLPSPAARPAYDVLFRGAAACLPAWARELWGVRMPSTAELAMCSALVRALDALIGDPPRLVEARKRIAAGAP